MPRCGAGIRPCLRVAKIALAIAALASTLAAAPAANAASSTCPNANLYGFDSGLPDCRAFELVSPSGEGEPYVPNLGRANGRQTFATFVSALAFRAAGGGDALVYAGEPSESAGDGFETHHGFGDEWIAHRGPLGWSAEDMTPAANFAAAFQYFSDEDQTGFYGAVNPTPLTPTVEAGCSTLYARASATGAFTPLYDGAPAPGQCGRAYVGGVTADEGEVAFQDVAALTPGAVEATEEHVPPEHLQIGPAQTSSACVYACNVYVARAGHVQLVSALEETPGQQTPLPNAVLGGFPLKPLVHEEAESEEQPDFSNAISTDGSRVFWTDTAPGEDFAHVFVLEDHSHTVPVSGSGTAQYWTASPDGRFAFYTEGGALWRFDTTTNTRAQLASAAAEVQGVIGTNQVGGDGAYLYFVANGALTAAPNSEGERASAGDCEYASPNKPEVEAGCNLYFLHEGTITYIARLSAVDDFLESANFGYDNFGGDWASGMGERLAELTPDGRGLVFLSVADPTHFPQRSHLASGEAEEPRVYNYDAPGDTLSCASCSPTGEPAPVASIFQLSQEKLTVPYAIETFMRRWISGNGARVFFESRQSLAPQASPGLLNVYEWERPASADEPDNSCTEAATSPYTGGCTYLLSPGVETEDSFLVDADAEGNNVFIAHVGPLGEVSAPSDHNEIYDVRVDGGLARPAPACTSECQPAPVQPSGGQASTTEGASAAGDFPPAEQPTPSVKPLTKLQREQKALRACRRIKLRKARMRCERAARARYGPKRSTRSDANTHRKGGHR